MVEFSHHITRSLKMLTCAIMLTIMSNQVFAATGTVTINGPSTINVTPNSKINVSGTYLLSSDNTPTGSSPAACVFPPGTNIYFNGSYPGTFVPTISGSSGGGFVKYRIHATAKIAIDGKTFWWGLGDLITHVTPYQGTAIGKVTPFSFSLTPSDLTSTSNIPMTIGTTHTITVYLEDLYMGVCKIAGRWVTDTNRGSRFASATLNFKIIDPKPTISITLGNTSPTACEAQTATINVTSNDPTPNGGTVTLTFPNGTTASAAFAGKSAILTLADFGLPNGYLDGGAHPAGSTLNFTASVTTAAGQTASATATAHVVAGGLMVTVKPTNTVVEPTLPIRRKKGQNGTNQTPVTITVKNKTSQPIDGANIALTVERASTKFGGHDHDATTVSSSIRPLGTVSSVVSQGQGVYTTTYTASEFAAQDTIRAKVDFQGCSANAVSSFITARLFGLSWLQISAPHVAIGGTVAHHGPNNKGNPSTPDNNHWVTLKTNNTMSYLMTLYSLTYGAGLYINDASLPFGGKFDVNGNWSGSHSLHRRGIDLDIRLYDTANTAANETVKANFKALELQYPELEPLISYKIHSKKTINRHLHIYFW